MSKQSRRERRAANRRAIEAEKRINANVHGPNAGPADDNPPIYTRGGAHASVTYYRAFFGG